MLCAMNCVVNMAISALTVRKNVEHTDVGLHRCIVYNVEHIKTFAVVAMASRSVFLNSITCYYYKH